MIKAASFPNRWREMDETNPRTLKRILWFDLFTLIIRIIHDAGMTLPVQIFHNAPICSDFVFVFFKQCLRSGRLLSCMHMCTFDAHSKCFRTRDRFPSSTAHRCCRLPTWLNCHCCCRISVTRAEIIVSFLCIQSNWNGLFRAGDKPLLTRLLHASLKTHGGGLSFKAPPTTIVVYSTESYEMTNTHTLIDIFIVFNRFLLNNNSWHRTDKAFPAFSMSYLYSNLQCIHNMQSTTHPQTLLRNCPVWEDICEGSSESLCGCKS